MFQQSSFCSNPLSQTTFFFGHPLLHHHQQLSLHSPRKAKPSTFRVSSLGAGFFDNIAQIGNNKVPHLEISCLYVSINHGLASSFDFFCSSWQPHFLFCCFICWTGICFVFCDLLLLRFWLQLVLLWQLGSFLSHLLLFFYMGRSLMSSLLFKLEGSHHHTLLYGLNQLIIFSCMPLGLLIFTHWGFQYLAHKDFAFSLE